MSKFFVSYAPSDKSWAEWIAWQIEDAGHDVRIQAWDFPAGSNYVDNMQKASEWADFTVMILSPDYLASKFRQMEWYAKLIEDPVGQRHSLLPFRVKHCHPTGLLKPLVSVDLVGLSPEEAHERILTELRQNRAKPKAEPAYPGDSLEQSENLERPPENEPKFPPTIPAYSTPRHKELSEQLHTANRELKERTKARQDTTLVLKTIRSLKQQMREGGSLEAGDSLDGGRYELLDIIGEGGFAYVWRGWDEERQEEVAIKVLQSRHAKNQGRLDRFRRGAWQMRRLSHPNIVRILSEPMEDLGYHFFIMEYVSGEDFSAAVKNNHLSMSERWKVIYAVGEALQYAHNQGIIHRDVTPSNILVDAKGEAKLTDFDLVKVDGLSGGTTKTWLGKFCYSAPETQKAPKHTKPTVDVFSLGMTAIFGLYGKDLDPDVFRDSEGFLANFDVSDQVKAVVLRAVEWNPTERWQSAASFCAALEKATHGSTVLELLGSERHDLLLEFSSSLEEQARRQRVGQQRLLEEEQFLRDHLGQALEGNSEHDVRKATSALQLFLGNTENSDPQVQEALSWLESSARERRAIEAQCSELVQSLEDALEAENSATVTDLLEKIGPLENEDTGLVNVVAKARLWLRTKSQYEQQIELDKQKQATAVASLRELLENALYSNDGKTIHRLGTELRILLGDTAETDRDILRVTEWFERQEQEKRIQQLGHSTRVLDEPEENAQITAELEELNLRHRLNIALGLKIAEEVAEVVEKLQNVLGRSGQRDKQIIRAKKWMRANKRFPLPQKIGAVVTALSLIVLFLRIDSAVPQGWLQNLSLRNKILSQDPAIREPGPGFGILEVRSNVWKDNVLIDGESKGPTPQTIELPSGKYHVEVRKNNCTSTAREIYLEAGQSQKEYFRLTCD